MFRLFSGVFDPVVGLARVSRARRAEAGRMSALWLMARFIETRKLAIWPVGGNGPRGTSETREYWRPTASTPSCLLWGWRLQSRKPNKTGVSYRFLRRADLFNADFDVLLYDEHVYGRRSGTESEGPLRL